ncbi:MAG: amidohydrolase family protein [Nevskiaceae bacterium]|jgi:imidazolonepropionase-like amidohydrolase|nr:amidohydrolase family protein [Nevskiaceae bacterium]
MHPVIKLAVALAIGAAASAAVAQNAVITNARIIVGDGTVIERGSVVVQDGKIASVGTAAPARNAIPSGAVRIDGAGKTVMAGFIDVHRHLIQGRSPEQVAAFMKDQAADRMRELLEAGFTTVQSGGDNNEGILTLKRAVESGQIKGPRILASAGVPSTRTASTEEIRAGVRAAKASGADSIAEIHYPATEPPNPVTKKETENLLAALDEARKIGIPLQIHAVDPNSTVATAAMGGVKLIHTPHNNWLTEKEAESVRDSGAQVGSCTGFGPPVFDVFNHDNKPTFRDGKFWPEGVVSNEGQGREGGLLPINGRTLFDHGVTYAYCTDTTFNAMESLNQELKTLNLVFSPIDIIKIMGPNSAKFIDRENELGTVQAGKVADLVVLGGNPLVGFWNFMTTEVVLKGGVVMVDKRGKPNAGKPMDKPQN